MADILEEKFKVISNYIDAELEKPNYQTPLNQGLLTSGVNGNIVIVKPGDEVKIKIATGTVGDFVIDNGGVIEAKRTEARDVTLDFSYGAKRAEFFTRELESEAGRQAIMPQTASSIATNAIIFHEKLFINHVLRKLDFDDGDADQTVAWDYGAEIRFDKIGVSRSHIEKAKTIMREKLSKREQSLIDSSLVLVSSRRLASTILQSSLYADYKNTGYKDGEINPMQVFYNIFGIPVYFFDDNRFSEAGLLPENIDAGGHPGGYCYLLRREAWKTCFVNDSAQALTGSISLRQNYIDNRNAIEFIASTGGGSTLIDEDGIVRIAYRSEML